MDDAAGWRDLSRHVRGPVIRPGDGDYEAARRVWNGAIDRHPAGILRCADVADVQAGVRWAREHDVALAVRGGGHSVPGHGTIDDGLVLDLAALAEVGFDPRGGVLTAGGGATWGAADALGQEAGHVVPGGVFSRTGIAGLTLSGGYGWLRNVAGVSCSRLVAAQVVTAEGDLVETDAERDPELLWGLRGGGGNFGIVTRFGFRAFPLARRVYFLFHDGRDGRVEAGLRLLRDFCADAPARASVLASVGVVPAGAEAAGFEPGSEGAPFVAFAAVWAGDPEEGEWVLRPLREFAPRRAPLLDASGVRDWVDVQRAFDEDYPDGARYYWKSLAVDALGDAAISAIADIGCRPPSDASTVDVWHLDGAARRPFDGAFEPPNASYLVNPEANWADAGDDDANIAWARELVDALAPHSDGARYLNFAGYQEDGAAEITTTFGPKLVRLRELKRTWDPDNVFASNPNIVP